jgi:hypothetical protein
MFEPLNFSTFKFGFCDRDFKVSGERLLGSGAMSTSAALQFGLQGIGVGHGFNAQFLNFRRAFPIIRIGSEFDDILPDWSKLTNLNAPEPIGCVFCCATVPSAIIGIATRFDKS